MSYLGSWKINDYLTFPVNTHDPSDGSASDADSVPTYRIYEDETATPILTGSMALLDSTNTAGFYTERVQLTAASGLEKGKSYTIYIAATVGSVTGTLSHTFQIEAEVDANAVSDKTGYSLATTPPTAVQIRTEIDSNSTQLAAIVADTNELQTDDVPGLIAALNDLDSTAVQTAVSTALTTYDPPTKSELDAGLAALNDVSSGDVETAVGTALTAYDPPTKAELDAGFAGLNDLGSGDVETAVGTALTAYDPPTKAELDAGLAALNDVSSGDVETAVGSALTIYDPPTKAELDAGLAALNDPAAADIADAVWNEAKAGHTAVGSFGEEVQAHALSTEISALNDVSSGDVETAVGAALTTYDPPTKAELDAGLAALNDLDSTAVQSAAAAALTAYDPPTKAELDTAVANVSVDEIQATALADLFNTDSGTDYASAVAGSVVKEIADNAGGSGLTEAGIADAVWNETLAEHLGTGSTGEALNAAGAAGDPWTTSLPGAYGAGSAGYIIGNNLDDSVADLAADVAALNDLSAAQVNAEVDTALADYDGPTKTELDTAVSALATAAALAAHDSKLDTVDANVGAVLTDTNELQTDDVPGLIAALNDLDSTAVQTAVSTALTAYDPPTKGELDAAQSAIQSDIADLNDPAAADIADAVWNEAKAGHTAVGSFGEEVQAHALSTEISALNDISSGDVETAVSTALTAYDPPTKAELDAGFAGLNDLSSGDVETAVGSALTTYDPPTKAELDTAVAQLATAAALDAHDGKLDTVDGIVDAILADTAELQGDWTNGGRLDLIVDAILNDTAVDIPALIAALNDLSAAEINAEMVDVLRTDTIPDSAASAGSQPTIAQAIYLITQFLTEKTVSGTTVTVRKPDGATALATFTLDDGTTPASITRSS